MSTHRTMENSREGMVLPLHPGVWHRARMLMAACWTVQSSWWMSLFWKGDGRSLCHLSQSFFLLLFRELGSMSHWWQREWSVTVRPVTVDCCPPPGGGYHGRGAARSQPVWLHQVQSGQQEEPNQHGHHVPWEAVFKTNHRQHSDLLRRVKACVLFSRGTAQGGLDWTFRTQKLLQRGVWGLFFHLKIYFKKKEK